MSELFIDCELEFAFGVIYSLLDTFWLLSAYKLHKTNFFFELFSTFNRIFNDLKSFYIKIT